VDDMAKKPKPPSLFTRANGLIKRNPWKFITAALALLAGIPGYVAGANYLEPAVPAQRYWVRNHVEEETTKLKLTEDTTLKVLRDLQIETAEGKRDNAANARAKFELDYAHEKNDERKLEIGKTIRSLQGTEDKLNQQIKTLNKLRGQ